MRYSELIQELEYWKEISGEDDPEIVVNDEDCISFEIDSLQPAPGIEDKRAIGIVFYNS